MFASVAGELATPRVAPRVGYRRLLVAGLVLLGAPAFALSWVTDLAAMLLVGVVRGLGFAIVVTATGRWPPAPCPVERRGEGLGLMGVVSMVPAVTALPAGVWLAERLGTSAAFVLGARRGAGRRTRLPRSAARRRGALRRGVRARLAGPPAGHARPAVVFAVAAVAGGAVVTLPAGRRRRPRRTRRARAVRAGADRDGRPVPRRPLVRPARPAPPAACPASRWPPPAWAWPH